MDIEGTEAQQRRFDRITGQHKAVTPEDLAAADLSGMRPTSDCEGSFLPYDPEGSHPD